MRDSVQACIAQLDKFGDSFEIAEKLQELAADLEPEASYWVTEAAEQIRGLFSLCRQTCSHLSTTSGEEAEQLPGIPNFMLLPEVLRLCNTSKSAVYKMMKEGSFPASIRLPGNKTVVWRADEVSAWLKSSRESNAR